MSQINIVPPPEIAPYWRAASEGRLLIKHCNACDANYFYPRPFCPSCMSDDTDWLQASGCGTLYSFTVWRRKAQISMPAFVALDEGPSMMTEVVDCDPARLRIGQRMKVVFVASGGRSIPAFTPWPG